MPGSGIEGRTLGPYRVISQIGAGGMAKIYKAYQPSMERTVALKVLPEQYAQDPQFVERFYREARTIAQLEHRNILPVYDFGEQDGMAYLVMRFLDGGTLKARLDKGQPSLSETVEILGQVCAALDYAHRNGVVHRDVKPSNVLIDREGAVYLSDFGLARLLEGSSHLTQTGIMLGTPAYMSPEQCVGAAADRRSDIYSLGVVLYEMMVGQVPFQADTPMAVLYAHLHEPLPVPRSIRPEISEALQNVILKAMAKNPDDRYQTAAEMGLALRRAIPPESAVSQRIIAGKTVLSPPPLARPVQEEQVPPEETVAEEILPPAAPLETRPLETAPAQAAGEPLLETPGEAPEQPVLPVETKPVPVPPGAAPISKPVSLPPPSSPAPQEIPEPAHRTLSKKRSPAMLLGFGLAAVLLLAGLGRGIYLAVPRRTPQATPLSMAATLTPLPRLTSTSRIIIQSQPSPTPQPPPTSPPEPAQPPKPLMVDDFQDPALEGKMNPDFWSPAEQDACQVGQKEGAASIGNLKPTALLDCSAGMKVPGIRGLDLQSMEASFRVVPPFQGDGQRTGLAWIANLPRIGNAPEGSWIVKCGIVKENTLVVSLWIEDMRMGMDEAGQKVYSSSVPTQPDAWSRLRLQVEPETMTFSCWMGDQLVGMYNPVAELRTLQDAIFRPFLLILRPPQSTMTIQMDELVFLPHELVPRAAAAATPQEGCLPPPDGIVGWWTGDGTLDNLVFLGRGQAEGAWGFAKGMVGQAFAFQNFPARPGAIFYPIYPAIKNLQTVTVEGWVRLDGGPFKRIERFLTIGPEVLVIRHDGNVAPGALHFFMKIKGELRHVTSQRLLKSGIFHHVAGTYDGKVMRLYLDGLLMNSQSIQGTVSEDGDGMVLSGGEVMDGLLDEFTLYNRALSGEEIQAIYQAGSAGKCRP